MILDERYLTRFSYVSNTLWVHFDAICLHQLYQVIQSLCNHVCIDIKNALQGWKANACVHKLIDFDRTLQKKFHKLWSFPQIASLKLPSDNTKALPIHKTWTWFIYVLFHCPDFLFSPPSDTGIKLLIATSEAESVDIEYQKHFALRFLSNYHDRAVRRDNVTI